MNTCINCGKKSVWIEGDYCELCRFAMGDNAAEFDFDGGEDRGELEFARALAREQGRRRGRKH